MPAIRARRHKYDAITKYIEIELEDLWSYQFLPQVKENRAKYWPTRDERTCAESHIICCNKFDFVLETISINPFNTTHFGWIDAYLGSPLMSLKETDRLKEAHHVPQVHRESPLMSLKSQALKETDRLKEAHHVPQALHRESPLMSLKSQALKETDRLKEAESQALHRETPPPALEAPLQGTHQGPSLRICENYTNTTVPRILRTIADEWNSSQFHIQILNVCDKRFKEPQYKREYYNQYRWLVCGGFFVTSPEAGVPILSRLKEIFVETTMAGYGHGEEMFYLEVLDEYRDQIRGTYGDYGQMLDNFIYPTRNAEYIYHVIMANYQRYGYAYEYAKAAAQLKASADKSWILIDDETYRQIKIL
jgi:hypothetical protein